MSDYGAANFMQHTLSVCPGATVYSDPEAFTKNQTVKVRLYLLLFQVGFLSLRKTEVKSTCFLIYICPWDDEPLSYTRFVPD